MPTMNGTIFAQWVGYSIVTNSSHTIDVRPNNRDITTTSALGLYSSGSGGHFGEAGVWRIVSNGVQEEFDPPLPRIRRFNVTRVIFRTRAADCSIRGTHQINYWT